MSLDLDLSELLGRSLDLDVMMHHQECRATKCFSGVNFGWWSVIHDELSAGHAEIWAETLVSSAYQWYENPCIVHKLFKRAGIACFLSHISPFWFSSFSLFYPYKMLFLCVGVLFYRTVCITGVLLRGWHITLITHFTLHHVSHDSALTFCFLTHVKKTPYFNVMYYICSFPAYGQPQITCALVMFMVCICVT